MNLFQLHSNPKQLKGYEYRHLVPEIAYDLAINRSYKNGGKRSPDLEPAIAKDVNYAWSYWHKFFNYTRWPAAEPVIAKSPDGAVSYALLVFKGRWPEAEPTIAKSAHAAYRYAHEILHKRWPEGEPAIATDPETAYLYAIVILKRRWIEAEPMIALTDHFKNDYEKEFGVKI